MYYAYALVHKDKDGYEIPLESYGKVVLYKTKDAAEEVMGKYKTINERYIHMGRPEMTRVERKWWFDKIDVKTVYPTEEKARELKLIMNTLYVKRVKLA